MGYFYYNGTTEFEFDDRVLAHLKVAIGTKLRAQESFFLNWVTPKEQGSGRHTVWLSPAIPLIFKYAGSQRPTLNPQWVHALLETAHTPRGMVVMSEEQAMKLAEAGGEPVSSG